MFQKSHPTNKATCEHVHPEKWHGCERHLTPQFLMVTMQPGQASRLGWPPQQWRPAPFFSRPCPLLESQEIQKNGVFPPQRRMGGSKKGSIQDSKDGRWEKNQASRGIVAWLSRLLLLPDLLASECGPWWARHNNLSSMGRLNKAIVKIHKGNGF